MAENKARLQALGIGKPNSGEEEDDDYRPGEDEIDDEEGDEEFLGNSSSDSRRKKFECKKKSTSAPKRKQVLSKKNLNRSDPHGEDDDLNKAIALSLQDSVAVAGGSHSKTKRNDQDAPSCKSKKPELMMSKMQMTEDELLIYFYHFDEARKGFITLRDVAKMATVHDFTWTHDELQDMIRCFDLDQDGKLSVDDFTNIVTRCRMFKQS